LSAANVENEHQTSGRKTGYGSRDTGLGRRGSGFGIRDFGHVAWANPDSWGSDNQGLRLPDPNSASIPNSHLSNRRGPMPVSRVPNPESRIPSPELPTRPQSPHGEATEAFRHRVKDW